MQQRPIGRYKLVIVAPISSKMGEALATNVMLAQTAHGFALTGLSTTSVIQLHKMTCIGEKRLQGQVGILSSDREKEVIDKLKILFNL